MRRMVRIDVNTRRCLRIPYRERVNISWHDRQGQSKFATVHCLDVSEQGILVELVEGIDVRSYVTLRCDKLKLVGTAVVRHCRRNGGKFLLGLEFSQGLRCSNLPASVLDPALPLANTRA